MCVLVDRDLLKASAYLQKKKNQNIIPLHVFVIITEKLKFFNQGNMFFSNLISFT